MPAFLPAQELLFTTGFSAIFLGCINVLLWRCVTKPGTLVPGYVHVIRLLRSFKSDLLISTHPHINRSYFDLAQWVLSGLRCLTCCTDLDGGFAFSRNS